MPKFLDQDFIEYNVNSDDMSSQLDQEDKLYQDDVNAVKQWWTDSRWRHTKRSYTAEDIVAKRGNLKIEYPSNVLAKKLWNIVEGRFGVLLFYSTCPSGCN